MLAVVDAIFYILRFVVGYNCTVLEMKITIQLTYKKQMSANKR